MCIASNRNCRLNTPVDAAALGLGNITISVQDALKNVQKSSKHSSQHPHIVVEHNYHDHATDKIEESIDEHPARGGVTTPFPLRLHAMLDKLEADGHADVISWQPHGRCFVVRKPKEFKLLLPKYFKLSKMASFQRQLNLYGFQRLTQGRDKNGYYHEYFLRGKPALARHIQRNKVKGTGVRARSNPSTEPQLWEMKWVGTDHDGPVSVTDSDPSVGSSADASSPVVAKPAPISSVGAPLSAPQLASSPMSQLPAPQMSSSWLQQTSKPSTPSKQQQQYDDDIVMSFGGKRFHYLDPFELVREAQLRTKQYQACQRDDMQDFVSSLHLDNFYDDLEDQIMDDDDAFINMLQRIIE